MACGLGAFALGDVITGMAAYSVIVLSAVWYFCWSWIQLSAKAASVGISFGSSGQLAWAWLGTVVALPLIPVVLYLAAQAFRLPLRLAREIRPGKHAWGAGRRPVL